MTSLQLPTRTPLDPPRDLWRPYRVAGIHPGPDHTRHADHHGHRDRESKR